MADTFTLTGSVATLPGVPFVISTPTIPGVNVASQVVVFVVASEPSITDTETNLTRLGTFKATVASDGSFVAPDLPSSADDAFMPAGFSYRLVIRYRDAVTASEQRFESNWFELTADTDFADVVNVALTAIDQATYESIIGARDGAVAAQAAAEAARDAAVAVSTGALDPANAVLINDPDSDTAVALATSYGADVRPEQFGSVASGVDCTSVVQAAINAVYAAGGGQIGFGLGWVSKSDGDEFVYRIDGKLTFPNDGHPNMPKGKNFRLYGPGPQWDGQWRDPQPGGVVLDLRYAGSDAKIETRGSGVVEIDHLTIADRGTSSNPWIYTTQTTLQVHDNCFLGNPTKYRRTCDQDVIVMGGTTAVYSGASNSGFAGYGAVIARNFFSRIRRAVHARVWVNSCGFKNNTISNSCGSNDLAHGAPFVFDSTHTGSLGFTVGNIIEANTVEVTGYMHGFHLRGPATFANMLMFNGVWDAEDAGADPDSYASDYYFEGATANTVIAGPGHEFRIIETVGGTNRLIDFSGLLQGPWTMQSGDPYARTLTLKKMPGQQEHLLAIVDEDGDLYGPHITQDGGYYVETPIGDGYPMRVKHDSYATPAGMFVNARIGAGAKFGDPDLQAADIALTNGAGVSEVGIFHGNYTPEGGRSAPVGSMFLRTNGGAGTTLYIKESGGSGNTGWVAK